MQAIEKPVLTESRQRTFSVLLIDDDVDILTIFKSSLAQAGMHTYAFTNPMLAVGHFRRNANSYDIVVTDIRMPQMNGFQVARAVKQIRPDRSEEHTSELQSRQYLVCRLLLEK